MSCTAPGLKTTMYESATGFAAVRTVAPDGAATARNAVTAASKLLFMAPLLKESGGVPHITPRGRFLGGVDASGRAGSRTAVTRCHDTSPPPRAKTPPACFACWAAGDH